MLPDNLRSQCDHAMKKAYDVIIGVRLFCFLLAFNTQSNQSSWASSRSAQKIEGSYSFIKKENCKDLLQRRLGYLEMECKECLECKECKKWSARIS